MTLAKSVLPILDSLEKESRRTWTKIVEIEHRLAVVEEAAKPPRSYVPETMIYCIGCGASYGVAYEQPYLDVLCPECKIRKFQPGGHSFDTRIRNKTMTQHLDASED